MNDFDQNVARLFGLYISVFTASLGLGASLYLIPVYAEKLGASYFDLGMIGTA